MMTDYKFHSEGHGVNVFMIEGEATLEGLKLERRDGLGIWNRERDNHFFHWAYSYEQMSTS